MASEALAGLMLGLEEIRALQKANPSPVAGGGLTRPEVTRAMGRAQVVLLSSHYERYLYALNEEAAAFLIRSGVCAGQLPLELRMLHSRDVLDDLSQVQWDRREDGLRAFALVEAPIWNDEAVLRTLEHQRLLSWMKSPKCRSVQRLFRQWGITDVFSSITRKPTTRAHLWLHLSELVDKRNNIAHGDPTTEATYLDIVRYMSAVRTFCERADQTMARHLARLRGGNRPW